MTAIESIIASIRGIMVPIRPEGWPFIAVLVVAALFFGWFWQPIFWIGIIVAAWCAYFFRDPKRVTPIEKDLVVSPADGRVVAISLGVAPKELGLGEQSRRRVSIRMSLFDCQVNRAPMAGLVARRICAPGKAVNADRRKVSQGNEPNGFVIETGRGPVGVVQIAGLVARWIVAFAKEGDELAAGERIGMIRFGSRVDLYLPAAASVVVAEGQTMIAGESVIARFGEGQTERGVRID